MRSLSPRQLKFVNLYLATGNGTQSYIDAGYKGRGHNAESGAAQLLRNSEVKKAIQQATQQTLEHLPLTYENVLQGLWKQANDYGEDASHAARVRAHEALAERLQSAAQSILDANGNVLPAELRRRLEALRERFVRLGIDDGQVRVQPPDAQRLPTVVENSQPRIHLGVEPPRPSQRDSDENPDCYGAPD